MLFKALIGEKLNVVKPMIGRGIVGEEMIGWKLSLRDEIHKAGVLASLFVAKQSRLLLLLLKEVGNARLGESD